MFAAAPSVECAVVINAPGALVDVSTSDFMCSLDWYVSICAFMFCLIQLMASYLLGGRPCGIWDSQKMEDAKDEKISSSFAKQCINCILSMHMLANLGFCSIKVPQVNGVVLEPFAPWGTFALTRQILEALGMRSFFLNKASEIFAVSIENWMLKNHVKFGKKDAWRPPFFTRTYHVWNSGRGMPNSTAPTCWNAHTAFNLWEVEWDRASPLAYTQPFLAYVVHIGMIYEYTTISCHFKYPKDQLTFDWMMIECDIFHAYDLTRNGTSAGGVGIQSLSWPELCRWNPLNGCRCHTCVSFWDFQS